MTVVQISNVTLAWKTSFFFFYVSNLKHYVKNMVAGLYRTCIAQKKTVMIFKSII